MSALLGHNWGTAVSAIACVSEPRSVPRGVRQGLERISSRGRDPGGSCHLRGAGRGDLGGVPNRDVDPSAPVGSSAKARRAGPAGRG